MNLPTIVVYNKSNNVNALRVYKGGIPVNLTTTEQIQLRLDNGQIISSIEYPFLITWSVDPDSHGLIYLKLGVISLIATRTYTVELLVFDLLEVEGTFYGFFRLRGIEESYIV